MSNTFNTRIQSKFDTFENWSTNNPLLLKGELAVVQVPVAEGAVVDTPAVLFKVGDGTNKFNSLPWSSALAADVHAWAKEATKPTYTASEITGLSDFINGEIEDTDTQYQIVKNGNMGFKLQSKSKGGSQWSDVNTIELIPPAYTLVEGTTNGTVKFNGSDIKVHGLGSAAYTDTTDYDEAGAADAVLGTSGDSSSTNTVYGVKKLVTETKSTLQSSIDSVKAEAESYTDTQITAKLSAVYKPAGSIAASGLVSGLLVKDNLGKVYNLTDKLTVNSSNKSNFVENVESNYPAGTNIVVVDTNNGVGQAVYKFDILAGFVDLSGIESDIDSLQSTIAGMDYTDNAQTNQFVTSVKQTDGKIAVTRSAIGISNITNLSTELGKKANAADLHDIATTGKFEDLEQDSYIIFNCGSSSENI